MRRLFQRDVQLIMTFKSTSKPASKNNGRPQDVGSIFDPVLCEIAYRWFCPPGGQVFDPFAGGSVRGIVAGVLGRKYTGIELRPDQCGINFKQSKLVKATRGKEYIEPNWVIGDSLEMAKVLPAGFQSNFVFSCPPYGDLEKYSGDPRDISGMDQEKFLESYRKIVKKAVKTLRKDSFCAFVVGDYRDKRGFYVGFPSKTIQFFEEAGARLYNEAVLVTAVGSLSIRVGKQFGNSRKLGKTHQNVLVFCKGDPKKATAKCGPVDVDLSNFEKENDVDAID